MSVHGKFPTRDGVATGSANERTMLAKVGYDGIRTEMREGANGLVTMLRTRGGHPEFSNKPVAPLAVSEPIKCTGPYGFVDTTFNLSAIGDATGDTLQYLIDEAGAVQPPEKTKIRNTHSWKESFHDDLPSNYSGLMRRLMQVEHAAVPLAERNGFSCTFDKSHGLFVVPETSVRWLIEIDSTGVYRIPLDFCKDIDSPWADYLAYEASLFSSLPHEEANRILSAYWRVKKIRNIEKVKLSDAPPCYEDGYSPWYSWCGWAFNYVGTAATIAVARDHPSEPTWYQAALFDITITGAGDDGVPTYVSCAASSVSTLAHNINDYDDNENAFIQAPLGIPGKLSTVSLHSPISVAAQGVHAPIFSYFTRGGEKRVYYFDVFQSAARNETVSQPDSQTITISRTGTWTVGNIATGSGYEYPTSGGAIFAPASYEVTVKQISEGIVSEQFNGTDSGWCGFSGASLPAQNTDFSGSYSYTARTTGPSGFAAPAGYSNMHVSRLSFVGIGPVEGQVVDRGYLLPSQDQRYFGAMPVTTVIEYSSTTHYRSDTHKSTILLHGYDRESIGFVHSKTSFESACVESGTYPSTDGMIIPTGGLTMARENTPTNTWTGGVDDWGAYQMQDGQYGPAIPSKITGWYDWSPYIGVVATAYRRVNDHVNNPANFEDSGMAIPGIYEVIPEKNITTRTLYVFVGDMGFTESISHNDFHQTYFNGESFRFWAGRSYIRNAVFYSTDINKKPKVINVGSYAAAQRSLFGFIGVF